MLLEIAVTLILAKTLNYVFEKLRQPGVIGEILAGIILGPCFIGRLSGSSINLFGTKIFEFNLNLSSPEFKELAFVGIVFLLFTIGLETDLKELRKVGRLGTYTAICGLIVPFLFGFLIGFAFKLDITKSMVIGAIFFATSITISARILSDMDLLSSRVGLTLQIAGIISDIVGLFIFSLIIGQGNPLVYLLRVAIFFIFILTIGLIVIKYAIKKGITKQTKILILPVGLIICFLFAAFAEDMGLAAIIGAFAAGLIIKRTPQAGMVTNPIKTIGQAFFIPIFFVWIGSSFSFSNIISSENTLAPIFFITTFIILGLAGNVLGGTIGAKLSGLNLKDSFSLGIAMMPIMGMALIILSTSTERGIFGDPAGLLAQQVKTATLLLIVTSCLLTPPILKRNVKNNFSKKRDSIRFKRIVLPISEIFPKISIKIPKKITIKRLSFDTNLLLIVVCLQIILILLSNRIINVFTIVAIIFSAVGSCFGYVILKSLITKSNKKSILRKTICK